MTQRCQLINDRKFLKGYLEQIYSSTDENSAQIAFGNCVRSCPQYNDLFEVALNEKLQQLSQDPFLSKNQEAIIKKNWLLSLLVYCFINIVAISFSVYSVKNALNTQEEFFVVFVALVVSIVSYLGGGWLAYHCAYKHSGSKLLFWIICTLPLYWLSSAMAEGLNLTIWSGFCFIAFIFLWINSFRLRKFNLKEQAKRELTALKEII